MTSAVTRADFASRLAARLKENYALDIRALSLMRVLIGGLLLADLIIRATSLTAFYTNGGAVPFNEVEKAWWMPGYFSLFQFSDSYNVTVFLFFLAGLIYFCLLIGYRTRIFSVLAWLMLLSIQNRNHAILQCGDDELRLILFWGIFLPWGNFYSVDARRYPSLQAETNYFDVPGLAYLLLLFSVYFFTGILKDSPEWDTREGSAFYYALSLDQIAWPLGKMLLPYTGFLKFCSIAAKWIEIFVPFLFFIPYKTPRFRMLALLILVFFHIAISLTLFVGLFYLISIFSLAGLLSTKAMDKLERIFCIQRRSPSFDDVPFPTSAIGRNYYFRVAKNAFVIFCMALCLIWNLGSVPGSGLKVADRMFRFGFALRLDQRWNMFAPAVLKEDGWLVMDAITKDQKHIDINRSGKPVDFSKPANVLQIIKDDRWRKFQENFVRADNGFMRSYYCSYLLRSWNSDNPEERVDSLNLYFMKEFTLPPGQPQKIEKELLCRCSK
jgi:hypothetical protein